MIRLLGLLVVTARAEPCLVLTDSSAPTSSVSVIKSLCGEDSLEVKRVDDPTVGLFAYGGARYSNLVISVSEPSTFRFQVSDDLRMLPESDKYRTTPEEVQVAKLAEVKRPGLPGLALSEIIQFVDAGKNVVVLASGGTGASSDLQSLLSQFGMVLYADSLVVDFFSPKVMSSGLIRGEPWIELVSGSKPIPFNGSPIGVDVKNENVFPALRASSTAVHASAPSQGSALTLAACNQATNGARFTLIGSTEIPDDFARSIFSWTFGKRALLRTRDLFHHKVGETEPPRMYREKDEIEFGIKLEEFKDGKWILFPATDLQLEYVMLDPYVRETMTFTGTGHKLQFKAPDVYGIFKFRIDYRRKGYNPIRVEQVAPVRNPRHNDYERFLFCGYPYYGSCLVTLTLVFVFAVFFVNHKDKCAVSKEARHRE